MAAAGQDGWEHELPPKPLLPELVSPTSLASAVICFCVPTIADLCCIAWSAVAW